MLTLHCGGAVQVRSLLVCKPFAAFFSPFPLDVIFIGIFLPMSRHSTPSLRGLYARGLLPVFGPSRCPDSLAAHLSRLLAAQQPQRLSAFPTLRFSFFFRAG